MKKTFFYLLAAIAIAGTSFSCNGNANKDSAKNDESKNGEVVMYITRHGKTIFNTMDRVQGWADSPLTPAGVEVAEDLGRGLQDTTFVAIYTSDSGRARETADIVMSFNKHNADVPRSETKDLREWYFGSFEGDFNKVAIAASVKASNKPMEELTIPEMADNIAASDPEKQAEDWQAIETRVKRAIDKIATESAAKGGGNVLVVCHGLTISSIVQILDSAQAKPGLHNASVTKVIYKDGKYSVVSFNDMEYVEKGKSLRQ
ncbi:histidine phosphatase family protein [Dysgonomonas macrotermitis]|uniref:Probable phosphoglycerate mutase n=1 Tax=Dysgonomonas macrotermitis TaxID=1346286 RepID=A0A1M4SRS0_9BACT|nr:histidine phosphatase family protein [Dysgonomonas macrotermitis]SHE34944.1 probable phosphoglycerate mutase [Dysgonomonas macrotermitis]